MKKPLPYFYLLIFPITVFAQGYPQVVINEFMASNATTIADNTQQNEDWIEIFNPTQDTVDLSGWYLSDNPNNLTKHPLPAGQGNMVIPPGGYILFWASGDVSRGPRHLDFSLSAQGEAVIITAPNGTTVIDSIIFGAQTTDVSMGRFPDGSSVWRYFSPATPNATNSNANAFLGVLPPVGFSHTGGFFASGFSLSLNSAEPGATIIYTLDGSKPDSSLLSPKAYPYKNVFQELPASQPGPLLYDSLRAKIYSTPISVQDRNNEPNNISDRATAYYDYTQYKPLGPVKKGTVISARAFKPGYLPSPVSSHTYFVDTTGTFPKTLPVWSFTIQSDYLFHYNYGIHTPGVDFDNWRQNAPNAVANAVSPANYNRTHPEHPFHLEIFEAGTLNRAEATHGGFRNHGGWSRARPRKTMRLYFRNQYGKSHLEHKVFPYQDDAAFKRLLLRNSGNDEASTNIRDMSIHSMVRHMKMDIMDMQSVAYFFNGEFWGVSHVRERFDKHYFLRKYGIQEGELDFLERHGSIKEGSNQHYFSMFNYINNNNMAVEQHFEQVKTQMDVENFADYQIVHIYFGNNDWPHNNIRYYRKRTPYNPSAPEGHDGRWRWLVFDVDRGMELFSHHTPLNHNTLVWATHPTGNGRGHWSTLILRKLLDNPDYRNYFINRYADMLNTAFLPSVSDSVLTYHEQLMHNDMMFHLERWRNRPGDSADWYDEMAKAHDYLNLRPAIARTHIKNHFILGGINPVTVDVSDTLHGWVKVNTLDILPETYGIPNQPYPWSGLYFEGAPVTLKASAKPGYNFSHWDGDTVYDGTTLQIDPRDSTYVIAIFEPAEVVHYWHFNMLPPGNLVNVYSDTSAVSTGLITYPGNGSGAMDRTNNQEGTLQNQYFGNPAGSALRVRNPSDTRQLIIEAPFSGYKDAILSFAAHRTNNGAEKHRVYYTIDKNQNKWVALSGMYEVTEDFEVYSFSLVDSVKTYNQPHLAFKIEFLGNNASGTSGNHRFDNVAITGKRDTLFDKHPEPFVLENCNYHFDAWADSSLSGTFPKNMVFAVMNSQHPTLSAGIYDFAEGNYDHAQGTRVNGLNDSGLAFVNAPLSNPGYPEKTLGGALLSLDLSQSSETWVQFEAGTHQPQGKQYGLRLQYRLGYAGPFQDVLDTARKPVEYIGLGIVHHDVIGPVQLPDTTNGKPVVQLFWRYFFTGEILDSSNAKGHQLRLDNIVLSKNESLRNSLDTGIVRSADTLWALQTGANYQWINCDNGLEIPNATLPYFVPDTNGNYAAIVSFDDCSDTTSCISVQDIGLEEKQVAGLVIFPNPARDELYFKTEEMLRDVTLTLSDMAGQVVLHREFENFESESLNIAHLPQGVYLLTIRHRQNAAVYKVVKE